ncbi:MAG TPA: VWA domain-containing protein, partial [Gammaproteobacteria bacterium]|nr:VWA domain-containing protein [Gammaproteobacteria bacterium]
DYLNIIKFGSHYDILSDEQLCINKENRTRIENYIQNIDANMGGTEMDSALTAAYKISSEMDMPHDALLITDGEVWNEAELISNAKNSHHRIFTIGVGSSVAENIVRGLAEATGGACELVTPNESMADKIHRHFKRMHTPRAKAVNIAWSQNQNINAPTRCTPDNIRSVYAGDTLHVFGWFNHAPEGHMQLEVTLPDGTLLTDKSRYTPRPEKNEDYFLSRMGTASLLKNESTIEDSIKAEMAVEYQLMTQWTNYLVVHERTKDKATELPELRTVPQTLAAGWGGTGSIAGSIMSECDASLDMPCVDFLESPVLHQAAPAPSKETEICKSRVLSKKRPRVRSTLARPDVDEENIETVLSEPPSGASVSQQLTRLITNLNAEITIFNKSGMPPLTFSDLKRLSTSDPIMNILYELFNSGHDEKEIVIAFVHILTESIHKEHFDRPVIRAILWSYKQTPMDNTLLNEIKNRFDSFK